MARVLVLGAHGNAGRNYAKCLKMAGHQVLGMDIDPDFWRPTPDIYEEKIKYIPPFTGSNTAMRAEEILRFVEENGIEFIHPQPDQEVDYLCYMMNLPEWFPVFSPYVWKLRPCKAIFDDKFLTVDNYLGYKYPDSHPREMPIYVSTEWTEELSGTKIWARKRSGAGSKGAQIIWDFQDYLVLKHHATIDYMFTEYLPGPEFSVHTFWIEGQLVHSQGRERLEYMNPNPDTGQSSSAKVAQTIINGHEAYEVAYETILASDEKPDGIYNVDMRASNDGQIFPTEVNYGRYNTTMDFFAELGMNTPAMQVDYWTKNVISMSKEAIGKGWRWYRELDEEPKLVKVT